MDRLNIEISKNGSLILDRSNIEQNSQLKEFFLKIVDEEDRKMVEEFFGMTENVEVLFGDKSWCG